MLKERWTRLPCFVARSVIGAGSFLIAVLVTAGGAEGAAVDAVPAELDDDGPDVDLRACTTISRRTMLTAGAVLGRGARQMGQRGFVAIREW